VLGRVLHRPVIAPPVPAAVLRVVVGEFARPGIVAGQRALPRVLERTGYEFRHDTAEKALHWATSGAK
jgi:NAD dependent epimerase/dehydratase family enzyme